MIRKTQIAPEPDDRELRHRQPARRPVARTMRSDSHSNSSTPFTYSSPAGRVTSCDDWISRQPSANTSTPRACGSEVEGASITLTVMSGGGQTPSGRRCMISASRAVRSSPVTAHRSKALSRSDSTSVATSSSRSIGPLGRRFDVGEQDRDRAGATSRRTKGVLSRRVLPPAHQMLIVRNVGR